MTTTTTKKAPAKAPAKKAAPKPAAPRATEKPAAKKLRWQFAEGHDRSIRGTVAQYATLDGRAYALTPEGDG
jgi:hypothetical protein